MVISDETFKKLSNSIACTRFPLVMTILFLHAYTASTMALSGHSTYFKVSYPLALWIGETGVPAYFFISGLLLYYSSKTYFQQIKSRFHSLFIPYLIWNTIIILIYVAAMLAGFDQEVEGVKISDYGIMNYLRAYWDRGVWYGGDSMPMLTPMWYIRNLMIFYLLSPVFYLVLRSTKMLFPIIFILFWINTPSIALTWQSLSMFCLGAIFPIMDVNPIDLLQAYKKHIIMLFLIFGIADIMSHCFIAMPFSLQIHRLALISNIFFVMWLGVYISNKSFTKNRIYLFLSNTAFFIFCTHYPINQAVRKITTIKPEWPDIVHIIIYFFSVAIVLGCCLFAYKVLEKYVPKFLHISTGNRG